MTRTRFAGRALVAMAAVAALGLSACGATSNPTSPASSGGSVATSSAVVVGAADFS